MSEINEKSKKSVILEAYQKVLSENRQLEQKAVKLKQEFEANREKVQKIEPIKEPDIIESAQAFKRDLIEQFDQTAERMIQERKKLSELQEAIELERQRLEQIHGIQETAEALEALKLTQLEVKTSFEAEMEAKKLAWQEDKSRHEKEWAETLHEKKKTQSRLEEEYQYTLKKRQEEDQYNYEREKRIRQEKLTALHQDKEIELQQREQLIQQSEKELETLRTQASTFPDKLEEEKKLAAEKALQDLKLQAEFSTKLSEQRHSGELAAKDQMIDHLNGRIQSLEAQVKQLTQQAQHAAQKVQDMAMKALDHGAIPARPDTTTHPVEKHKTTVEQE